MPAALEKERLFFQIYQNLEKEILDMTDYIHFSEKNLNVYSIKLANFILRANVECESLLKELYKKTEHFKKLSPKEQQKALEKNTYREVNKVYNLDKKTIYIASEIFYFQDKYSEPFIPFKYEKNNKDSYKIYNAIKHDKVNNLEKADLETAINLLGTLFVLNLYFYPGLIYKKQDESSKIFRVRKAFLAPLLLSGLDEIDRLDKSEVEEYLASCCYYEWLQTDRLNNPTMHALSEFKYMLEKHKDEINLPLNDALKNIEEKGVLFDSQTYPLYLKFPTMYSNNETTLSILHSEAKTFYEALEQVRVGVK